ncbi:MAG: phosphoribosyl-ATP diphosphatase [Candidatus Saccharicenans sp.]
MIIPSIDLMEGQAVQLRQGRELLLKNEEPLILAEGFHRFGPLAVIDLDAALDKGNNLNLIKEMCRHYECRVGGGIRSLAKAIEIIEAGAEKIIVGSAAWDGARLNTNFLDQLSKLVGREHLILALDCYKGNILIKGWTQTTGVNIFDILTQAAQYSSELLITCVEREGCLQGTDLHFYQRLRENCSLPIIAAGGVSSLEEISRLSRMDIDVQLGLCLYQSSINLPEAFIASLNWSKGIDGLLPTVTVDENGIVLMLAWSSPESLHLTFEHGQAYYYSRQRRKLWGKGEQSGHFQELIKVRSDCDGDTILFVVRQKKGIACHKNQPTCFGHKSFHLHDLYSIIHERLRQAQSNSYTASLNDHKVRGKLKEETQELIDAKTPSEIIWEAADLFYFILVLLARNNITLTEVLKELDRRNRSKSLKRKLDALATLDQFKVKGDDDENP